MDIINLTFGCLILNVILLFCLLSPNIVYLLHKKWFTWKVDKKCFNCDTTYHLISECKQDCDRCGRMLYSK